MAKITDGCAETAGRPAVICDISPPRSGNPADLPEAFPDADFLLVGYGPGRAVRADSAMTAAQIRRQTGRETAFTLITRDLNRLALQAQLLGAQLLGLGNVVVAAGDPFQSAEPGRPLAVDDYRPTELIAAIAALNRGWDFRNAALTAPTDFCIGATVDLGRDWQREVRLTRRKIAAGADFLITQPIYDPARAIRFQEAYAQVAGERLPVPVFYGLQILEPGGIAFGPTPPAAWDEIAAGRSPVDQALELYAAFRAAGLQNIYLVPGILPGGRRNYAAAQRVIAGLRGRGGPGFTPTGSQKPL